MLTADHFLRSGKVRDLYELPDGRLLLVASDRISAFDVVLPTEIPDKGRVLTGLSRFWFAETAGIVPNHLLDTDLAVIRDAYECAPTIGATPPGRADGRLARGMARSRDDLPERDRRADRGGRPRLSRRLRLEGVPRARHGLRHPVAGRPPRERPIARADLHAGHEGRTGRARREHRLRRDDRAHRPGRGVRARDRRGRRRGDPRPIDRPVPLRRRHRRSRRDPAGRHEVRVRPRDGCRTSTTASRSAVGPARADRAAHASVDGTPPRRSARPADRGPADPHRRGAHPRFVALLGRRHVRAGPRRRPASTSSSCATGSRRSPGTRRRPGRHSPTTSSRARAPATSRRSSGSPAPASSAISRRTSSPDEHPPIRRQCHAQAGHPRPAGTGRRGQPRPPRDQRASAPCASAGGSS